MAQQVHGDAVRYTDYHLPLRVLGWLLLFFLHNVPSPCTKHGITWCFKQPKRFRVNVCVCVCINSVLIDQLSRERDDVSSRWQLSKTALEQLLQERQQLHENMVQTHR